MKKNVSLLLAALAAVLAVPASAQDKPSPSPLNFTSDSQVVPSMANVAGQHGAMFETHISIMNPTAASYPVRVSFYDGSGTKQSATITLAPGELKVYENFLDEVFHYTGAGAAKFEADETSGGGHNSRFIVSAEVWTSGANGRFGTTVPVVEFAGSSVKSFAAGVSVNASTRTNVGCFNQAAVANSVKATIFDGTGKILNTMDLPLAANAWGQVGVNASVTAGYVQFQPAEAAVCWAVVVDNSSNDGRFVSAAEYTP